MQKKRRILLEICCGSAGDVAAAFSGGADRVELNSDLFHGGLTPSIGAMQVARSISDKPIMAMVRPRAGGFCYDKTDFRTAMADGEALLKAGADGLVFGFLHCDQTIDMERCRAMIDLCAGRETVFHRAMDLTPDWRRAFDQLMELGVTRVLTSGQGPACPQAIPTLREMVLYGEGRLEVLPGGGVKLHTMEEIVKGTGCTQIHLSSNRTVTDVSGRNSRGIHLGGAIYPPEDAYDVTDASYVERVSAALQDS